ncbi:hypothetical protein ACMYSQ_012335 [Aspergillus niger]
MLLCVPALRTFMAGLCLTWGFGRAAQASMDSTIDRCELVKNVHLLLAEPFRKSPYTEGNKENNQDREPYP